MNKEEIEEIKRLLFQDRLTQYRKRKLVQYLEQKESILDKVKDKLKEDIDIYKNSKELTEKEQIELEYAKEILNIIEGGKK